MKTFKVFYTKQENNYYHDAEFKSIKKVKKFIENNFKNFNSMDLQTLENGLILKIERIK